MMKMVRTKVRKGTSPKSAESLQSILRGLGAYVRKAACIMKTRSNQQR
jgi:hypothetical protein